MFTCPNGDATLSLEVAGSTGDRQLSQFYFECPDLDKTVARFSTKGLAFTQEPTDMDYLWREARLQDADGHNLRRYFAGDNHLKPPWKIEA